MANTLTNFLVGVGFDLDKQSANEVNSSLDGIKGRALQLGTVVAGAFGLKSLTNDFAASRDEIGKFSQVFGLLPSDVFAFGQAIEHEGGTLGGFMSQLAALEKMRAGLQQGDAGFIAQAGRAGLDVQALIEARSATEGYLALADQFQRMTRSQRLNAASALGLDEASIRLLSQGSEAINEQLGRMRNIRDITPEMTREAARYNDQVQDLTNNIGGFADRVSMTLLPGINDITEATNHWIDANRELINQNLDKVLEPIGEHFGTIAAAGGLLAGSGLLATLAGMARYVPVIGGGIGLIATGMARLSLVGAGAAVGYELWDWDADKVEKTFGVRLPDWVFTPIEDLIKGDESDGAVRGTPTTDFYNSGDMPTIDTPLSEFPDLPLLKNNPQSSNVSPSTRQSRIDVQLNLDGSVLDRRTISVIETQNELALSEIQTSMTS